MVHHRSHAHIWKTRTKTLKIQKWIVIFQEIYPPIPSDKYAFSLVLLIMLNNSGIEFVYFLFALLIYLNLIYRAYMHSYPPVISECSLFHILETSRHFYV